MPVGMFVKKIFDTEPGNAAAMVHSSFIAALEANDTLERANAQRLIDWYQRKPIEVRDHVRERAKRSFESTKDWQLPIENGVPRTIRRLSTAYSQGAIREYVKDDKVIDPKGKDQGRIDKMLERVDVDRKMRTADRFSTLLNTIHVEVVYRKERIDWDMRLRPSVTVVADPEDFLELSKFAYQWKPVNPETLLPEDGWIYWTDELHVFISKGGKMVGLSDTSEDGIANPYKDTAGEPVIPIVTVRKLEDIDDYWGNLGEDLVDGFEVTTVQLGNMWETVTLQTHGQPLFINVELPGGVTVKWGAKHPFIAKNVTKDDVEPDIKFPKPDPDITGVRDLLDWYIKQIAASYGLPPSAWSLDEVRQSGFAKFMDNIELIEQRDEDATQWQDIEVDLFNKSRIVWNHWNTAEQIDTEIELRVKFPDVKVPETPTEKTSRWMIAIQGGQASLVDYFMEEEGLDESAAEKRAIDVAKANKKINEAAGTTGPVNRLPAEEGEE